MPDIDERRVEELTELIAQVIGTYLDDLNDPGDVDADDLAENLARHLVKGER